MIDRANALLLLSQHMDTFRRDFLGWLTENWPIFEEFTRKADEVWFRGRKHYSARTIIEVIRHETSLREKDSEVKINNNFAPGMARLYLLLYPERQSLFQIRDHREEEVIL